MTKQKNYFEVVRQADIAPLIHSSDRRRILSITFDPSLARTREMLLTGVGFEVSTFGDLDEAIAVCQRISFDLVVLGHSIPLEERRKLIKQVHALCSAPVLAMLRHGEGQLPEADYFFDSSENPARLLETVINILRSKEVNM